MVTNSSVRSLSSSSSMTTVSHKSLAKDIWNFHCSWKTYYYQIDPDILRDRLSHWKRKNLKTLLERRRRWPGLVFRISSKTSCRDTKTMIRSMLSETPGCRTRLVNNAFPVLPAPRCTGSAHSQNSPFSGLWINFSGVHPSPRLTRVTPLDRITLSGSWLNLTREGFCVGFTSQQWTSARFKRNIGVYSISCFLKSMPTYMDVTTRRTRRSVS